MDIMDTNAMSKRSKAPPPPQMLKKSEQHNMDTSNGHASTRNGNSSTNGTKPKLNTRSLRVHMPNGKIVQATVDANLSSSDLLVMMAGKNKLNPVSHMMQVPSSNPPGDLVILKPSQCVGDINGDIVFVVAKAQKEQFSIKRDEKKSAVFENRKILQKGMQPEKTIRLTVNYGTKHRMVLRINPERTLADLLPKICEEKGVDPKHHTLRHPKAPSDDVDLNKSLTSYQTNELLLVDTKAPRQETSVMPELSKDKKKSFFGKLKKKKTGFDLEHTPSAHVQNAGPVSPTSPTRQRQNAGAVSPTSPTRQRPTTVYSDRAPVAKANAELTRTQTTKKRAAPKPPDNVAGGLAKSAATRKKKAPPPPRPDAGSTSPKVESPREAAEDSTLGALAEATPKPADEATTEPSVEATTEPSVEATPEPAAEAAIEPPAAAGEVSSPNTSMDSSIEVEVRARPKDEEEENIKKLNRRSSQRPLSPPPPPPGRDGTLHFNIPAPYCSETKADRPTFTPPPPPDEPPPEEDDDQSVCSSQNSDAEAEEPEVDQVFVEERSERHIQCTCNQETGEHECVLHRQQILAGAFGPIRNKEPGTHSPSSTSASSSSGRNSYKPPRPPKPFQLWPQTPPKVPPKGASKKPVPIPRVSIQHSQQVERFTANGQPVAMVTPTTSPAKPIAAPRPCAVGYNVNVVGSANIVEMDEGTLTQQDPNLPNSDSLHKITEPVQKEEDDEKEQSNAVTSDPSDDLAIESTEHREDEVDGKTLNMDQERELEIAVVDALMKSVEEEKNEDESEDKIKKKAEDDIKEVNGNDNIFEKNNDMYIETGPISESKIDTISEEKMEVTKSEKEGEDVESSNKPQQMKEESEQSKVTAGDDVTKATNGEVSNEIPIKQSAATEVEVKDLKDKYELLQQQFATLQQQMINSQQNLLEQQKAQSGAPMMSAQELLALQAQQMQQLIQQQMLLQSQGMMNVQQPPVANQDTRTVTPVATETTAKKEPTKTSTPQDLHLPKKSPPHSEIPNKVQSPETDKDLASAFRSLKPKTKPKKHSYIFSAAMRPRAESDAAKSSNAVGHETKRRSDSNPDHQSEKTTEIIKPLQTKAEVDNKSDKFSLKEAIVHPNVVIVEKTPPEPTKNENGVLSGRSTSIPQATVAPQPASKPVAGRSGTIIAYRNPRNEELQDIQTSGSVSKFRQMFAGNST
ncbi:uncharacterized protein [Antedon mediterranea]|uniref:uncharacterized protein isoform X2 n=1 Tax=Antedon mediterranea TaxID=105859 RepID=UPI003AF5070F